MSSQDDELPANVEDLQRMLKQLIEDRLPAAARRVTELKEKRTAELEKLLGIDFKAGDTDLLAPGPTLLSARCVGDVGRGDGTFINVGVIPR